MATLAEMTIGVYAAYRTSLALDRHTESAHGGKINSECPACTEIQAKMAWLKEEDDNESKQTATVSNVL